MRGFSLIEFMVATAIAGFVALAGIAAATTIIRDLQRNEETVISYDRAKTLMDIVITRSQSAGGGALRPWAGVQVIDDAANSGEATVPGDVKAGTDLLYFLEPDDNVEECGIVAHDGANLSTTGTLPCCLTAGHEDRPITIVTRDGTAWGTAMAHNVHGGSNNCSMLNFPPGQAFGAAADKLPGSNADFAGGALIATKLTRLYVNTSNQLIMQAISADSIDNDGDSDSDSDGGGGGGGAATLQDFVVSDHVYDLQVAFGYDADGDGNLLENGTVNDEWLYNAPGDAWEANGLADASVSDLRMALIGVTVGTPRTGAPGQAQLLNGPTMTHANVLLRSTTSRAFLRNLNIFF